MFKKISSSDLQGNIIRQDERYTVIDVDVLKSMTLSRTILQPAQKTGGHSHDGLEEIYIFESGCGTMKLIPRGGEAKVVEVKAGDIVLIEEGTYHQVINSSNCESFSFLAIFQRYER